MLELREQIYRLVMIANSYVFLDDLKPNKNLESINDNGDESDYGDPFAKAQRSKDTLFPRHHADFYPHPGITVIDQARETESKAEWETHEEEPIKEKSLFAPPFSVEGPEAVRDEDMESEDKGHVPPPASSAIHNERPTKSEDALAILRTCRQVCAEASPVFYSMVEVVITPEEVVDLHDKEEFIQRKPKMKGIHADCMCHFQDTHYKEGIFETLGLASLLDFATFTRIERIRFDADYNFCLINDSPSLHVDEDFHTSPNNEAELIAFMKRTRTVENFVSLLATLPRLRQLGLILVIGVELDFQFDDDEDAEVTLDFDKASVANQRATELFMECGMLDPLRRLSNVQNFDLEVETEGREVDETDDKINYMVLKPKHAKMAQDLKEAIEHNWTANSSIRG